MTTATAGNVVMSPAQAGSAYGIHLRLAKLVATLDAQQLAQLKAAVAKTAGANVGSQGVTTDNAGAAALTAI
ncbi:hypothetical protein ACG02S_24540 [Roseateles sp. DC23W]|uniref:Uncharacterized protein n=1 Tax=Pelomonas dachongensis TaxID=3299029 RepID=A0ABW7EW60_9BURK